MNRTITLVMLISLLFSIKAKCQSSRKEIKDKIEQLEGLITEGDYEMAVMLFHSFQTETPADKVPKSHREAFIEIERKLFEKQVTFDSNAEKVREFKIAYDEGRFCEATGLLDLNLSASNSTSETRRVFNSVEVEIRQEHERCLQYRDSLTVWKDLISDKKYERVWLRLRRLEIEQTKLDVEQMNEVNRLKVQLKDWSQRYEREYRTRVLEASDVLKSIRYPLRSYQEAKTILKALLSLKTELEQPIPKMEGGVAVLRSKAQSNLKAVEKRIEEVDKYCQDNRPLSREELALRVSSPTPLSADFIRKQCIRIDDLGGIFVMDNKPFYAYDLDVIRYYADELNLETDLQKQVYKESKDYSMRLSQLKSKRKQLLEGVHYFDFSDRFDDLTYDVEHQAFLLKVGSNNGFAVASAVPPNCFKHIDLSKLNVHRISSYAGSTDYYLPFSVVPHEALKIENRRKKVSLLFVFKIEDKEMRDYVFRDWQGTRWEVDLLHLTGQ